ncbi:hypothetical protein, partial [Mucilaginibacter sp. L3T2-6]|uniref:hypothetical protein n=1 Tax=Mucilaginibacter sp. L3T2-6 TaxID=3062491 RepID=UPI0026760D20
MDIADFIAEPAAFALVVVLQALVFLFLRFLAGAMLRAVPAVLALAVLVQNEAAAVVVPALAVPV